MPSQMIACPHCGAANSERKEYCYQCQSQLGASDAGRSVKVRPLRPRAAPLTQAPLDPSPVLEKKSAKDTRPAKAMPAAAAKPESVPAAPSTAAAPERNAPGGKAKPAAATATPNTAAPATKTAARPKAKSWVSRVPWPKFPPLIFGASLRHRVQFYAQLHQLLKSGIPLGVAFDYLGQHLPLHLRPMARACRQHMQQGGRLSEVMAHYKSMFPAWERSLISAAEVSGALPEATHDIARTLEVEDQMQREIKYKTLPLKATAVVAVIVFLILQSIRGASGISEVLSRAGEGILTGLVIVVTVALVLRLGGLFNRTAAGGSLVQRILPLIPMIGPIKRNQKRLRFTRVLGALWNAGVAPMESIELAAEASGDANLIAKVKQLAPKLGAGELMSDIVAQTRLYPPEAMYLLKSGETTGNVPEALAKIAEYLQLDVEYQVKALPMKLQLLFYAILAPIVGYMIISFWAGYYGSILGG